MFILILKNMKMQFLTLLTILSGFIPILGACKSIYCHAFNGDLSGTPVDSTFNTTRTHSQTINYTSDPGMKFPHSIVVGIRGFHPLSNVIDFDVSASIMSRTDYQMTIRAYSSCGLRYLPTTVILSASSKCNIGIY